MPREVTAGIQSSVRVGIVVDTPGVPVEHTARREFDLGTEPEPTTPV